MENSENCKNSLEIKNSERKIRDHEERKTRGKVASLKLVKVSVVKTGMDRDRSTGPCNTGNIKSF